MMPLPLPLHRPRMGSSTSPDHILQAPPPQSPSSPPLATSPELLHAHVQWQWCTDRLSWCPYPAPISAAIDAAFQSGALTFDFCIGSSQYTIHFQSCGPRQKNIASGRIRSVKRLTSMEGSRVSWFWLDNERDQWHEYDAQIANQIEDIWKESEMNRTERMENARAGLFCVINGHFYTIEFEMDGFQINSKTRFSRGVRRCVYDKRHPMLQNMPSILTDGNLHDKRHLMLQNMPSSHTNRDCERLNRKSSNVASDSLTTLSSFGDVVSGRNGRSYNLEDIMDHTGSTESESCSICLTDLCEKKPAKLTKCGHSFHRNCIESWFKNRPSCPQCLMVYGTITGTQPPGEMSVRYIKYGSPEARHGLGGYPNTDIIKIEYKFPNGIQRAEHPNPGRAYTGTVRIAYLPKNKDGEEVLELLKKAWDRRLLFRVGTSVTTGQANVVTWSTIHHKTHMNGGSSNHGYPDETYLARVRKELEEAGVL